MSRILSQMFDEDIHIIDMFALSLDVLELADDDFIKDITILVMIRKHTKQGEL
jgi:hypothetical protein